MKRIRISEYLKREHIKFIKSTSKKDVLKEMCELIGDSPEIKDKKILFKKFLEREKILSTAVGGGIAIPHIKLDSVKDFVVGIGISKKGIKFDSLDNKPVHIIIMIAAPAHKHTEYLKLLAQIVLVLKNTELRKKIVHSKNEDEIFEILNKK